eukprot:CCRYP_007055-RA/>CCRYP_007055-RA protein AED:0.15 eAED:0.15 QI:0/0.5/0.33/0.66/0/0/3/152/67
MTWYKIGSFLVLLPASDAVTSHGSMTAEQDNLPGKAETMMGQMEELSPPLTLGTNHSPKGFVAIRTV